MVVLKCTAMGIGVRMWKEGTCCVWGRRREEEGVRACVYMCVHICVWWGGGAVYVDGWAVYMCACHANTPGPPSTVKPPATSSSTSPTSPTTYTCFSQHGNSSCPKKGRGIAGPRGNRQCPRQCAIKTTLVQIHTHTHVHTHTHTHAQIHTRTHACTRTLMQQHVDSAQRGVCNPRLHTQP